MWDVGSVAPDDGGDDDERRRFDDEGDRKDERLEPASPHGEEHECEHGRHGHLGGRLGEEGTPRADVIQSGCALRDHPRRDSLVGANDRTSVERACDQLAEDDPHDRQRGPSAEELQALQSVQRPGVAEVMMLVVSIRSDDIWRVHGACSSRWWNVETQKTPYAAKPRPMISTTTNPHGRVARRRNAPSSPVASAAS